MSSDIHFQLPSLDSYSGIENCTPADWRGLISARLVVYQMMNLGASPDGDFIQEAALRYFERVAEDPLASRFNSESKSTDGPEFPRGSWYANNFSGEAVAPAQIFDIAYLLRYLDDHQADAGAHVLRIANEYLTRAHKEKTFKEIDIHESPLVPGLDRHRISDLAVDDIYLHEMDNVGELLISINLANTDEELSRSFKRYLKAARKKYGSGNKIIHTEAELSSWVKHKVLQYVDLSIFAWFDGVDMTMRQKGDYLFHDEYDIDIEERIRRVVIPKANKIMSMENFMSLPRLPE